MTSPALLPGKARAHALRDCRAEDAKEREDGVREDAVGHWVFMVHVL